VDVRLFPGCRIVSLVPTMVVGTSCIEHADLRRFASTAEVLGHRVVVPPTLRTFLREFDLGHVHQLDRLAPALLARAWALGPGPGSTPTTIDVDSTICELHRKQKQAAAYSFAKVLGCHSLIATRSETGEVNRLEVWW
jgi:hypothetical protein